MACSCVSSFASSTVVGVILGCRSWLLFLLDCCSPGWFVPACFALRRALAHSTSDGFVMVSCGSGARRCRIDVPVAFFRSVCFFFLLHLSCAHEETRWWKFLEILMLAHSLHQARGRLNVCARRYTRRPLNYGRPSRRCERRGAAPSR